jgi:hypothetical protein
VGLNFIGAVAVTVESTDLKWLFAGDRLTIANLEANWKAIAPTLDRLSVDSLMPTLQQTAMSAGLGPREWLPEEVRQHGYTELASAGLKDPLEYHDKVDAFRREEEQRYQRTEKEELIAGGFDPNNW